jgi:hypothetical protein
MRFGVCRSRFLQLPNWYAFPDWRKDGIGCEFGAVIAPL